MKRAAWTVIGAFIVAVGSHARHPDLTIRQIQEVPLDSLLLADSLQGTPSFRWTLQASQYVGDTVTITGVCVVPAKVLTFTAAGFTMLVYDTGAVSDWGSILVRVNTPLDTLQAIQSGFLDIERGDIIRLTGVVTEFPIGSPMSVTQFQPIFDDSIEVLGSAPIPPPFPKRVSDFYSGLSGLGRIRFSTGEPFESLIVAFINGVVSSRSIANGTFRFVDSVGNEMHEYFASKYFQLTDSVWASIFPTLILGTQIDTLRGFITALGGGSEGSTGYRIAPVFRGDVVLPPVVGVKDKPADGFPLEAFLSQNYPNPFNPTTTIRYSLPSQSPDAAQGRAGEGSLVSLRVYDILGREVASLVNKRKDPGEYTLSFNAEGLPSGVYLYRLQAGNQVVTRKMMVIR